MVALVDAVGAGAAASWRALRRLPDRREEAVAALNGLVGDEFDEQGHSLAVAMRVRPAGAATGSVCVMVHGLMATDQRWELKGQPGVTYGSKLAADVGTTPLYVTYNSGRHISTNGRELCEQLDRLVATWPVPVSEINFIGHSMGGLVVRSACHYGVVQERPWAGLVRRVFLVGAPNRGATLEQVGHAVAAGLQALPVAAVQSVGRLADRRSAGIKDLRHGSLIDEDWQLGRRHPVEMPPGAEVFIGCANVVGGGGHPVTKVLGEVLGDVLVSQFSAQGRRPLRSRSLCPEDRVRVFPGTGHVGLANSLAVYDQLLSWWRGGGVVAPAAEANAEAGRPAPFSVS